MNSISSMQAKRLRRDPRGEWSTAAIGKNNRRRRDRKLERALRTGEAVTADVPAQETAPSGRLRRNPRALRQGVTGPAGRQRISPHGLLTSVAVAEPTAPAPSGPQTVIIENPAYWIVVIPDLPGGRLSAHDRDVLGAARVLADADSGGVLVMAFGEPRDDLGAAGADRLLCFTEQSFQGYTPELRTQAVVTVIAQEQPKHVLFADSPLGGADLGRRVAAKLGERPASQAWRIDLTRTTCRSGDGKTDITRATPRVLLVAEEAAEPVSDTRYEARPLSALPVMGENRIQDGCRLDVNPSAVPLAEAEFIVAAGNGVRHWDNFHRLAQVLGASEGASRVAVDAGFMARDRQVGATGTLVTARCYLALGISGASQHLQGITKCEHVIAVNRDPACDMVKRANLAVIGDVQAILPELIKLAEERQHGT
jgi:electron transfer flavoprotein alpha subunit